MRRVLQSIDKSHKHCGWNRNTAQKIRRCTRITPHNTVTAPSHTQEVQAMVRVRCGVRHKATTRNTL